MADGHDTRIMLKITSPTFRIGHAASVGAAQFDHRQSVSPQQTPQRLGRGEDGPLGIPRSQQFNEVLHKRERAPGTRRGQMGDFDDLIAVNRATELVLQEPLHGQVEVTFRKERLASEADAGSALDAPGLAQLRDDGLRKRRQQGLVAIPVELLDCVFDDRPQAIGSRHHNEHCISPSRADPAGRVVDVFADGCLTSKRQDQGISLQSSGFRGG